MLTKEFFTTTTIILNGSIFGAVNCPEKKSIAPWPMVVFSLDIQNGSFFLKKPASFIQFKCSKSFETRI